MTTLFTPLRHVLRDVRSKTWGDGRTSFRMLGSTIGMLFNASEDNEDILVLMNWKTGETIHVCVISLSRTWRANPSLNRQSSMPRLHLPSSVPRKSSIPQLYGTSNMRSCITAWPSWIFPPTRRRARHSSHFLLPNLANSTPPSHLGRQNARLEDCFRRTQRTTF